MITTNLRTNQLSSSATQWYIDEYLAAMDALDIRSYAQHLDAAVELTFNNGPAVQGADAAVDMLAGYWKSFAAIEHDLLNIYGTDDRFMLEALNHYVRHDGKRVTTHAVALTDRNAEGKVTSVRVFADTSPIFQE